MSNIFDILSLFTLGAGNLLVLWVYSQSRSVRERQRLRLLLWSANVACAPAFLLFVLFPMFHWQWYNDLRAVLAWMSLGVLPLGICYIMLRYRLLVGDQRIRKLLIRVFWLLLVILFCLLVMLVGEKLFARVLPWYALLLALVMALLAPLVWWCARQMTEYFFFHEYHHYRRVISEPAALLDHVLDLEAAVQTLVMVALHTFETSKICLFLFEEQLDEYYLCPPLTGQADDSERRLVIEQIFAALRPQFSGRELPERLSAQLPAVKRLMIARRPLLLREVLRTREPSLMSLSRYMMTEVTDEDYMVLAPLRAQGRMIGLLVLGERNDHQPYAGPDFEAIHFLTEQFAPLLETARLYDHVHQHASLLSGLYRVNIVSGTASLRLEDVAQAQVEAATAALRVRAEIWWYEQKTQQLRPLAVQGAGPHLLPEQTFEASASQFAQPCFYECENSLRTSVVRGTIPAFLPSSSLYTFAWLPLYQEEHVLGALLLTYVSPHVYRPEEQHVLELFARRCSAALLQAKRAQDLRVAYEKQRELDRLKDQFILKVSHRLQGPLHEVQNCLTVVDSGDPHEYVASLERANESCAELTAMVDTIVNVGRGGLALEKDR